MKNETAKRLHDALGACREVEVFTRGKTEADFLADRGLQLIVHKLLEIVGEALSKAVQEERDIAASVPNLRRYISLRNQITHGYESVDYGILWNVSQRYIPERQSNLGVLLRNAPPPRGG